ncbi:Serine/threonine-protein phosphatase 1 regulatory subunit 10-like protein, partial [Dinothrombium tinctorium]
LMKKYSKKLVSRCTYCNILLATERDVLEVFLEKDGWDILNAWVKDAKRDNNNALLYELLKLLDLCPMTVERLKKNDTAKIIKTLSKNEIEYIAEKSKAIVTKWMLLIKADSEKTEKTEELKKKRKRENGERQNSIDESNEEIKASSKKLKKILMKEPNVKLHFAQEGENSADSVEMAIHSLDAVSEFDSKNREHNKILGNTSVKNEIKLEARPKTAKIRLGKSRSIFDEVTLQNARSKVDNKNKQTISKENKANVSSTGVPIEMLNNKAVKQKFNETLNESDSKPTGIKLIDPKPLPPSSLSNKVSHAIKESASFMDDIISTRDRSQVKKKRRLSNASLKPSSEDGKMDYNEAKSDDETNLADDEVNEDELPEMFEVEKQIEAQLSGTDTILTESVEDLPDYTERDGEAETGEAVSSSTDIYKPLTEPKQLKSILCYGKKLAQKKKSVRWQSDEKIREVKYFELDETERTNVSRNFGEFRALEMKNERQALLSAKRGTLITPPEREPIEYFPWTLFEIDFPNGNPYAEQGKQSNERLVQAERHRNILPEFYPSKEFAPDFPQEPDVFEALAGAHEAPKLIPLEDENNPQVADYSQIELPRPVTEEIRSSPNQFHQHYNPYLPQYPTYASQLPGQFQTNYVDTTMPSYSQLPSRRPSYPSQPFSNGTSPIATAPQLNRNPHTPHYYQERKEKRERNSRRTVCKFFSRTGSCKFKNCNYLHTSPNSAHKEDRRDKGSRSKSDNRNKWGEIKANDDWTSQNNAVSSTSESVNNIDSANSGWD